MGYLDGILGNIHARTAPGGRIEAENVLHARQEGSGLKKILQTLGSRGVVNDENLDWYQRIREAYPEKMILLAARECGRSDGTVEDVGKLLDSWNRKGIRTPEEAEEYIRQFRAQGELLSALRKMWGLSSLNGTKNRAMLTAWEGELGFEPELILCAAEAATGMERPMYYLDKVLRTYAQQGVRTKEQMLRARQEWKERGSAQTAAKPAKQVLAQQYSQRDYSGGEESVDEMMKRLMASEGKDGGAD